MKERYKKEFKEVNLNQNILDKIEIELKGNTSKFDVDFMSTDLRVIKNNIINGTLKILLKDPYFNKEYNRFIRKRLK